MNCLLARFVLAAVWTAVVMAGPPLATADWADSFTGGTFGQPWIFFDEDGASPPNYTVVDASASVLLMEGDAQHLPNNFNEFAAGIVGLGQPTYAFQNVRLRSSVRSTFNFNGVGSFAQGNNNSFVFVRSTPTLMSYLLAIDWAGGILNLERVNAGQTLTDLEDASITDFSIEKIYTIELAAVGKTLVGSLYDQGNLVSQVKAIDANYTSGLSGLGSSINANDALGTSRTIIAAEFDDVESISILPGDINIDGIVNRTDAAQFISHFGRTTGSDWTTGDFNNDGRTTLADWGLLRRSLTTGAPSPALAVPEPTSLGLVGMCVALLGVGLVRQRLSK